MSRSPTPVLTFTERTERVYFLSSQSAQAFVGGIEAHLRPHTFRPDLDFSSAHYITTLYFDSDAQAIARSCERGDSVKLRAREYYDREADDTVRREPFLWLEVKTREGSTTRKMRVGIPIAEVASFLQNGLITRRMIGLRHWLWGESAEAIIDAISKLCRRTAEPLRPDCLVHYRRRAWQDPSEAVRVTLDSELAFYRAPLDIFKTSHSLSEALIGPPVRRLHQELVEIKIRGAPPAWLERLIQAGGLQPAGVGRRPFSKFIAASHAVHPVPC